MRIIWIIFALSVEIPSLSLAGTIATITGSGAVTPDVVQSKSYQTYTIINIVDGPTSIDKASFLGCRKLRNISIPTSIISIDFDLGYTFRDIDNLSFISVSETNSVYSSDDQGALYNHDKTTLYRAPNNPSFIIPPSVKTLAWQCFQLNTDIVSLKIPKSVTNIHFGIIYDTNDVLRNITFDSESEITEITSQVFGFSSPELIILPKSVKILRAESFFKCYVKKLMFAEGSMLEVIESNCFDNAEFTELILPNCLLSIGESAFANCQYLQKIELPASVVNISSGCFTGCPSLSEIVVDPSNPKYMTENGTLFSKDKSSLLIYPSSTAEVKIPAETVNLGPTAIQGCTNVKEISIDPKNTVFQTESGVLYNDEFKTCVAAVGGCETITFHSNLMQIEKYAMYGIKGLKEIDLSKTQIREIGNYSFYGCEALKSVDLWTCEKVGSYAFAFTTSLYNLTFSQKKIRYLKEYLFMESSIEIIDIPYTIENFDNSVFYNAKKLKQCLIDCNATVRHLTSSLFRICTQLRSFTVPINIQSIYDNCFSGCSALRYINFSIASSLVKIFTSAFHDCALTEAVSFPSNLVTLMPSSFMGCTELKSIIFPSDAQISQINSLCFAHCESLEVFEVPPNVSSLDPSVFEGCIRFRWINCTESHNFFQSENGILYDKNWILIICPCGIQHANISAQAKDIGGNAFSKLTNVFSIDFLSGCQITAIRTSTFAECINLCKVTFSEEINGIDTGAIINCPSLRYIYFRNNSRLNEIKSNLFKNLNELESVIFGDGGSTQKVGESCFECCTALKTISIPSSVKTICERSFYGCTNLEFFSFAPSNQISDDLEERSIRSFAFYGCNKLSKFDFSFVTEIGENSFCFCNFKEINLTSNISLGLNAFSDCKILKYVSYCGLRSVTTKSFDNGVTAFVRFSYPGVFSNCATEKRINDGCVLLPVETELSNPVSAAVALLRANVVISYDEI